MAEQLYHHSYNLFDRIRDLLFGGHGAQDGLSFVQRIAWNFKKTKVDLLVGEVEKLKSTVQLLVQVLCTARQIRTYKFVSRRLAAQKPKFWITSNYRENVGKAELKVDKHDAVCRQHLGAENSISEWQRS